MDKVAKYLGENPNVPIRKVAIDLGLNYSTLHRWLFGFSQRKSGKTYHHQPKIEVKVKRTFGNVKLISLTQ